MTRPTRVVGGLFVAAMALLVAGVWLVSQQQDDHEINQPKPYEDIGSCSGMAERSPDRRTDESTDLCGQQESRPTRDAQPSEAEGDIFLRLSAGANWTGENVDFYVETFPRGEVTDSHDRSERSSRATYTLSAEGPAVIPIGIPEDGLGVRIGGGVLPMHVELRWRDDKIVSLIEYEIVDAGVTDKAQVNRKRFSADRHPTVVLDPAPMNKGDFLNVSVLPLVHVKAQILDAGGQPFLPGDLEWGELRWRLSMTGLAGMLAHEPSVQAPDASIRVPAGSELTMSPSFYGSAAAGLEPQTFSGTVPTDRLEWTVSFRAENVSVVLIRVMSQDGADLSGAQFRFVPGIPESYAFQTAIVPGGDGEVYAILLTASHREVVVWAPDHLPRVIGLGQLRRDGTANDVVLQKGQAVTIVRIDFDVPPTEDRAVNIRAGTAVLEDDRQWSYATHYALPKNGELTIYGQQGRSASIRPESDHYEFEETRSYSEGDVAVREFQGRILTGVILTAVHGEYKWDEAWGVQAVISRPLPVGDDAVSFATSMESKAVGLTISEPLVLKLAPGTWRIQVRQGNMAAVKDVEVSSEFIELEVEPEFVEGWKQYDVIDQTGRCGATGTTLLLGLGSLAQTSRTIKSSRRVTNTIRSNPGEVPEEGKLYSGMGISAVSLYRDNAVLLPDWVTGRVVVVPPGEAEFYVGVVNPDATTVTIRRPTWAGSVSFAATAEAPGEHLEKLSQPGWYVAVREYKGLTDLKRMDGMDFKVLAENGAASIPSMLPGTYVARYVRMSIEGERDPDTGRITKRSTRLEWCDAAKFEVRTGHTAVALPVTRE